QELLVFTQIQAWTDGIYFQRRPVMPSAEPPRDGWPVPLPINLGSPPVAKLRPAELPHEWWLPPRDYSIQLALLFARTEAEALYGPGKTVVMSSEFDLKLAPDATATVTLEVPG